MITITIKDILEDTLPDCTDHFLYRFYDGETTFYVGQSIEIEERLATHAGIGTRFMKSAIRSLIERMAPESLNWSVDLYTVQDCAPFLYEQLGPRGFNVDAIFTPRFLPMGIEQSEIALIQHYRPCLNKTHNIAPLPLPERYRHYPTQSSSQFIDV